MLVALIAIIWFGLSMYFSWKDRDNDPYRNGLLDVLEDARRVKGK